jgi:guanine nucleotide-binding protein subunit beta-2-like 1 protein
MQSGVYKTDSGAEQEFLVTGGRDNKVISWDIHPARATDDNPEWGCVRKVMSGHSHFIQDLALSLDSRFALSASWDKTLRLWDLSRGETVDTFVDHSSDVLTCSISADNRQIASGGRDKDIKIWNTKAECKHTVDEDKHSDWVSTMRFSPDTKSPTLATGSWDGQIKIWDSQTYVLKHTFVGHTNAVTSLAYAQKAMYLASGGKDGNIILWNADAGEYLKSYTHSAPINQVLFSKVNYWIVAATDSGIIIFNIVTDSVIGKVEVFQGEDE